VARNIDFISQLLFFSRTHICNSAGFAKFLLGVESQDAEGFEGEGYGEGVSPPLPTRGLGPAGAS